MNPKQTLLIVLTIVLTGEAVAELISDNFAYLAAAGCIMIFGVVVYAITKRSAR